MIEPWVAPMVRRMAISGPLSFTSMMRPEMMLSAATSTIRVRIRNMTLRSTCSALKNVALRWRQSIMKIGRRGRVGDELAVAIDPVGIVDIDLDRGNVAGAVEIGLRLGHRHEHERGVVFRHADLEHGGDLVGLDARRRPHRRHRAARRHQREIVAGAQRELIGEPAADHHALAPRSKPSSVPCLMLVAIERSLPISAARMPRTSTPEALKGDDASAWPSTIGAASLMPSTFDDPLGHLLPVGQRRFERLDQQMAVHAQDLVEQFLAEAVHHRHHDDQGGDAEHDAQEGKSGDDRDESFLAPRPQVTQRQHPFERREWVGGGGLAHQTTILGCRFHTIPAVSRHVRAPWRWRKRTRHDASRSNASSGLISSRLPSERRLSSTLPSARPFGPTSTCQGNPIRSAVANLAPGRWSRSS